MTTFTDIDEAIKVKSDPDSDLCEWFMLCANKATTHVSHPVLGDVPTCDRCYRFAMADREPM